MIIHEKSNKLYRLLLTSQEIPVLFCNYQTSSNFYQSRHGSLNTSGKKKGSFPYVDEEKEEFPK